jgi:uncharacterized protein YlxP (DUF503 family)
MLYTKIMIETKSFTAILHLDLHIPDSGSLKTKRRVFQSLRTRIENRFNVSVAEIDGQDKWQRAVLGAAMISGNKDYLNREIQKIIALIDGEDEIELIDYDCEII